MESLFFESEGKTSSDTTDHIVDSVLSVWGRLRLPDDLRDAEIISRLRFDNKRRGNKVPFAYLERAQGPKAECRVLTEEFLGSLTDCVTKARERLI